MGGAIKIEASLLKLLQNKSCPIRSYKTFYSLISSSFSVMGVAEMP